MTLTAGAHRATADTCWPNAVDPSVTGELLHYAYSYGGGKSGRPVMHAAMGRSRHGGHVWCGFMGTPESVSHLTQIWETDARGVKVVWRDPPEWLTMRNLGAERRASIYDMACARGLGPCYTREKTGSGVRTTDFARTCEKKDGERWYVTRSTGFRMSRASYENGERVDKPAVATYSAASARWQRFDAAGRTLADLNYAWYAPEPGLEPPDTLPSDRMFRLIRIGSIGELPCLAGDGSCSDNLADRPDEGLNGLFVCRQYANRHAVPDEAAPGE